MNESIKNMIERRSVRGYKPDMIPKEDLDLILEAGTYAATGMGMQSPVIVAVTDKATRDQLSKMNADVMGTDTDPFYGAPVVLVVLADKNRPTYIYDGSLVMGESDERRCFSWNRKLLDPPCERSLRIGRGKSTS